jgi:hypothetical protein
MCALGAACTWLAMLLRLRVTVTAAVFTQAAHVGLVMGNVAYCSGPLPACGPDARAVHAMYVNCLGFHMVTKGPVVNATNATMRKAMEALASTVQSGDTVVVHYSGHGVVKANGFHFVPVDVDVITGACTALCVRGPKLL